VIQDVVTLVQADLEEVVRAAERAELANRSLLRVATPHPLFQATPGL